MDFFGIMTVRKTVRLIDSIQIPEASLDKATDRSLAIAFLTKGMKDVDDMEGYGSGSKVLLGFAFEGSKKFIVASDDVLDLADFPITNVVVNISAFVSAENMAPTLLFENAVLFLSSWNKVELGLVTSQQG